MSVAVDEPVSPTSGSHRHLKSLQLAELVLDVTVRFCDLYVGARCQIRQKMVQAARSGVQNIVDGSHVASTSKRMELRLTNVARACLEELRLEYEAFLRQRDLLLWPMEDPRRSALVARRCANVDEVVQWVEELQQRDVGWDRVGEDSELYEPDPARASIPPGGPVSLARPTCPELAANAAHVLVGVACALLNRQIASLAASFERDHCAADRRCRPGPQDDD